MNLLLFLVFMGTGLAIALFSPEIVNTNPIFDKTTIDTKAIGRLILSTTGIVIISLGVALYVILTKLDELKKK